MLVSLALGLRNGTASHSHVGREREFTSGM